jgi:hypothetical protein
LYYCVRGKWTTSFRRLLTRCENEYPYLYELWLRYVQSSDPEEAVAVARLIVDAVIDNVGLPIPELTLSFASTQEEKIEYLVSK